MLRVDKAWACLIRLSLLPGGRCSVVRHSITPFIIACQKWESKLSPLISGIELNKIALLSKDIIIFALPIFRIH